MTTNQILSWQTEENCGSVTTLQDEKQKLFLVAILECAYQLAKLNENIAALSVKKVGE